MWRRRVASALGQIRRSGRGGEIDIKDNQELGTALSVLGSAPTFQHSQECWNVGG